MSRFNVTKEAVKKTTNHVGAQALKQEPELELISLLLTSFADDSYYSKQGNTFNHLNELLGKVDPLFAAKAAVYARTKFGMRSITHVMASELAKYINGKEWAKDFYNAIVHRPDDMLEIFSYHATKNGKETNAMRKGFSKAFGKFTPYELAKYRGESKAFKLVDIVRLVHPKATEKNGNAINDLMKGTLKSEGTWESELTKAGQKSDKEEEVNEFKKEAWSNLIKTGKIGIFAVLRNLRNIYQQAPEMMDAALDILTDIKRIKKSLILPFRYLTAYAEIEKITVEKKVFEKDQPDTQKILAVIEKAIMLSIDNLPVFQGKTVILSDNSGSMRGDGGGHSLVSKMSNTKTADIANLFALMYWIKADNTLMGLFGDRLVYPDVNRAKGLFDNFKIVDEAGKSCGASTERGIFDMFERMVSEKIIADTIVIFSDCQIGKGCNWYDSGVNTGDTFMKLFSEYKKINPTFKCYSVDLKGYGTTVFDGSVIKISGWSEKIFDIMKFAEQDKNALVNEIKKIEF